MATDSLASAIIYLWTLRHCRCQKRCLSSRLVPLAPGL